MEARWGSNYGYFSMGEGIMLYDADSCYMDDQILSIFVLEVNFWPFFVWRDLILAKYLDFLYRRVQFWKFSYSGD